MGGEVTAQRNRVKTYLGKRAFYAQDMARKHRAGQRTALPPRCTHCRRPGTIMVDDQPHCGDHALDCECVSEGRENPC